MPLLGTIIILILTPGATNGWRFFSCKHLQEVKGNCPDRLLRCRLGPAGQILP